MGLSYNILRQSYKSVRGARMKKSKVLFHSIIFVIISIILQVMVTFLVGIYHTIKTGMNIFEQQGLVTFTEKYSLLIIIIGWVVTLSIFFLFFVISKKSFVKENKLNKKISLKNVFLCFICGIGINITINSILSLIKIEQLIPQYGEIIQKIVSNKFYITLICVGILIPICEEIFYRGIILGKLRTGFGVLGAVIIQAILFGVGHMNLVQGIYAFVIGIIFGYVVIWTGSLYSSILLHIVINSLSTIISNVKNLSLTDTNLVSVIFFGILITIIGLKVLYEINKNKKDNIIHFSIK